MIRERRCTPPLFLFQGSISALAAFVKPCIDAGVPNLARDGEELRKATALFGSTWGVMLAVGAALGFVGVFAGAGAVPLAGTVMACELFDPQLTPYAAVACALSWLVAGRRGLYSA